MKAVAIIPARGGSKRIPKKNIKPFFGKPLIAYSIEVALESGLFDEVIVSTDDAKIAAISKKYGASVPFIRPTELSDDFTGTGAVIAHALKQLKEQGKEYDFVCTIYATAPLLDKKYLIKAYEMLQKNDAKMAFSATSMPFPIQRTFKVNENGRCEMFTPEHFYTRSQDLEVAYQDAGQFYFENLHINSNEIAFGKDSIPIVLPRHLVQDLDTLEDWERLEFLYQSLHVDRFDEWNGVKKKLNCKKHNYYVKQGDIYFISIGQNIGYESFGKSELFLRPVLVFKKINKYTFFGIPLTSKIKEGDYFHNFSYKKDCISSAMLTQMRMFDINRIKYRSGRIDNKNFDIIKEKMGKLLEITPLKKEGGFTLK